MRFRHNKTGNIYRHLAYATDCTNSRNGTGVVVYCKDDNAHDIFVREAEEFEQKFTPLTEVEKEICQNCGCEMPEGCKGIFVKDGNSCKLNDKKSALVFVGNGA